jgi:predicted nucleic acid-binding protein
MTVPDRIVFDAEPLVAHADDEPGAEVVEQYLDAVALDDATGYVNYVNVTEIRYILARKYDRATADEYLDWLADLGIERLGVGDVWTTASDHVLAVNPALGDAFALATAGHVDGTLLAGGDGEYDEVTDVPVERFREGAG